MGTTFETFTNNHKPLTWLFTKERNNTKIQRWSILLAEYGCRPQYYRGKVNVHADMLSRIKCTAEVATLDTEDWQAEHELIELPPDVEKPFYHSSIDMKKVAAEQEQMDEWGEAEDPEIRTL